MEEKTIFIVEDDAVHAALLHDIFTSETSYRTIVASEAIAALELLQLSRLKPDVFILDYWLPGIDGIQLCHCLRAQAVFQTVPVLLLSAMPPSSEEERAVLTACLRKPFELDELLSTIDTLVAG